MEVDDSEVRSAGASSESYDAEPAAVRRRLDVGGSFEATDQHRTGDSAPARRTSERRLATLPAERNEYGSYDNENDDELLLEVTLTQDCDTGPSVLDCSHGDLCTNVSCGDFVRTGVEQGVSFSYGEEQEVEKFDTNILPTAASTQGSGQEGPQPSTPLYLSADDQAASQQQENNTVMGTAHQWNVYREGGCRRNSKSVDGAKESSESDLSCANSSSCESSNGVYGDIDDTDYTGSLASSADLLEMFDNARDDLEMEFLREDDTVNIIGTCLEKVASKVAQLQDVTAQLLRNYCELDHEVVEGESIGDSSSENVVNSAATSHHTSEVGNSAVEGCTLGGRSDTSSEDSGSCEQRLVDVQAYILVVYSNYEMEKRNGSEMENQKLVVCDVASERHTVTASTGRSVSASEDAASTKAEYGTSEESASNRSLIDSELTAGTNKEDYARKLRNTCKDARSSRRIVSRQHGIMSQIRAITEQRVCKMDVACLSILNCVKGAANVVSPALEAKRVARLCLQQATAREDNTVFKVAEAAIAASRFTEEALTFAERTVQLHDEVVKTLREAKASLDTIQFEDTRGRGLSRQVSALEDEIDKLIEQTSNVSLEDLRDRRCVMESSTGTLSFALKEVKQQSTAVENMTHKCDKALSDAIKALKKATSSSVEAIDACLKAIQSFGMET